MAPRQSMANTVAELTGHNVRERALVLADALQEADLVTGQLERWRAGYQFLVYARSLAQLGEGRYLRLRTPQVIVLVGDDGIITVHIPSGRFEGDDEEPDLALKKRVMNIIKAVGLGASLRD
jgi:hypothetical protein